MPHSVRPAGFAPKTWRQQRVKRDAWLAKTAFHRGPTPFIWTRLADGSKMRFARANMRPAKSGR